MVQFKRKPVQFVPTPAIADDRTEVWVIAQTGEVFVDYDSYLRRMDFYKQRKFVCELTGHSGLDFFDALRSERRESKGVGQIFPEPLKDPVLRRVQFSTVSRIDVLVDTIYEEFKQVYYPGEHVTVIVDTGERLNGTVRAKTKFPEIRRADGSIERCPFSRYFVALSNRPNAEALVDDEHIMRDRKSFTKQVLRSFIKDNATRESWNGAPWIVKEHIAERYKIDTEVPPHLQHGRRSSDKKAPSSHKKSDNDGSLLHMVLNSPRLPELKPATKGQKNKQHQQQLARLKQQQFLEYQQALSQQEALAKQSNGHTGRLTQFVHASFPPLAPTTDKPNVKPPPPPPIKYPIEDLEIPPSRDGTHRPAMKFISADTPRGVENSANRYGIVMESVGPLLETWNTLNVFCQVLILDSFTFDDYLEALQVASESVQCELYIEVHCALLKVLVNDEGDGGDIQIELPENVSESHGEDHLSGEEPGTSGSPAPETAKNGRSRATRRSKDRSGTASVDGASTRASSDGSGIKVHRASEMMDGYGWVDRLRRRDFQQGGWETIIVGLLDQFSSKPQFRTRCEDLLVKLAPLHLEPTQETASQQYAALNINSRATILQILCMLAVDSKAFRGYLDQSSEIMTEVRKEKIEWQRGRKAAMEELRALEEQRKALLPDNSPLPSEPVTHQDVDMLIAGPDDERTGTESADEAEANSADQRGSTNGRSLRTRKAQAGERKRKRGQEREEEVTDQAPSKVPKVSNQFRKLLADIEKKKATIKEHELEIAKTDEDLREIEVSRTKCLGKDRFWNRYWFLERNGMPWGGLANCSTADAEYANGCLWVQGPDEVERSGFIDLSEEDLRPYRKAFRMSVAERKDQEEGSTSVYDAHQWGYFDEPDSLDMLIGWLDVRGNREQKLRKELQNIRGKIVTHMEKRKEYLAHEGKKKTGDEGAKRMSTRTKAHATETQYRCMRWKNTMAIQDLGHLHLDHPKPRRAAKRTSNAKGNKPDKQLGRQGTRYDF